MRDSTRREQIGDIWIDFVDGEPVDMGWRDHEFPGEWVLGPDGVWRYKVEGKTWYEIGKDGRFRTIAPEFDEGMRGIWSDGELVIYIDNDGFVRFPDGTPITEIIHDTVIIDGKEFHEYWIWEGITYYIDEHGDVYVYGDETNTWIIRIDSRVREFDDVWSVLPPEPSEDPDMKEWEKLLIRVLTFLFVPPEDYEFGRDMRVLIEGRFPFSMFYNIAEGNPEFFVDEGVSIRHIDVSMFPEVGGGQALVYGSRVEELAGWSRTLTGWLFSAMFFIAMIKMFLPKMVFK